jgi:hypothetical protein
MPKTNNFPGRFMEGIPSKTTLGGPKIAVNNWLCGSSGDDVLTRTDRPNPRLASEAAREISSTFQRVYAKARRVARGLWQRASGQARKDARPLARLAGDRFLSAKLATLWPSRLPAKIISTAWKQPRQAQYIQSYQSRFDAQNPRVSKPGTNDQGLLTNDH